MLGWVLISTVLTEYTDAFLIAESLIKQVKLPYSLHIHRIILRNIIIFFHNLLVMLPVIWFFKIKITFSLLWLIPGLFFIYINAVTYGLLLAILGTRYRDISQLIRSLIQVVFFLTPIMWNPEMLSEQKRFIVDFNPIYAFLELIRQPLLGGTPSFHNFLMVIVMTGIGIFTSAFLFTRYRARIVYWL
jgi:ABC-type polysaccharide/polyol phosphate export permease